MYTIKKSIENANMELPRPLNLWTVPLAYPTSSPSGFVAPSHTDRLSFSHNYFSHPFPCCGGTVPPGGTVTTTRLSQNCRALPCPAVPCRAITAGFPTEPSLGESRPSPMYCPRWMLVPSRVKCAFPTRARHVSDKSLQWMSSECRLLNHGGIKNTYLLQTLLLCFSE